MRVEEIIAALEARSGHGLHTLAPDERLLFVAWRAARTIERVGFMAFFADGGDPDELERAYRRLGLPGAAAACTAARQVFPPEHAFADRTATAEFLTANAADLEWAFQSMAHPLLAATRAGLRAAAVTHLRGLGMTVE
jgi:hypothetical protein